jgi:hypothetical protein
VAASSQIALGHVDDAIGQSPGGPVVRQAVLLVGRQLFDDDLDLLDAGVQLGR